MPDVARIDGANRRAGGAAEADRTIGRVPAVSSPFAALVPLAARLGLTLAGDQWERCDRLAAELVLRNRSVNLTAITEPADIAIKHFLDSFTALAVREWSGTERIVDVGSGAGFPGLALRIALPGSSSVLVESVGKKARWLEEISATLDLDRVVVRNARAEALGRVDGERGRHDVGTARAVGSIAGCLEYLVPLLVVGGEAIVWKGRLEAERPAAERACAAIGAEIVRIASTDELGVGAELPGRHLVVVRKVRETPPLFPRGAAEAKRRPW